MDEGERKMESLYLTRFAAVTLPRFVKVKQHFEKEQIGDIAKEVRAQLAPHLTHLQGKKMTFPAVLTPINALISPLRPLYCLIPVPSAMIPDNPFKETRS
jgi:hypothetical protein